MDSRSSIAAAVVSPSRRPSVVDVVNQYMNVNLKGEFHPALDTTKHEYCKELDAWIPKASSFDPKLLQFEAGAHRKTVTSLLNLDELYADSDAARVRFLKAMEEYQEKADPKYRVDMIIRDHHDWAGVMSTVEIFERKYSKEVLKGARGTIRRHFRKFCDYSKPAQCFLALLPTQSAFGSVLCGGFKLIFGAAERLGKVRSDISEALEEIPTIFDDVQKIGDIFTDSKVVHQTISALYVTVLHLLEHVLHWYTEEAMKKTIKAVWRQGVYEQPLLDKVQAMKRKVEELDKQAKTCNYQNTKAAMEIASKNNQDIGLIERRTKALTQAQEMLMSEAVSMKADIQRVVEASKCLNSHALRIVIVFTYTLSVQQQQQQKRSGAKSKSRRGKDILKKIDYDPLVVQSDLEVLLQLPGILSLGDHNRASALMMHPTLGEWIACTESSLLLVNGRSTARTRSPVSYVCATLVEAFADAARNSKAHVITLSFFCGEHLDFTQDRDAYPFGMMLTILAQLLMAYKDFDIEKVRPFWQTVQQLEDISSVCRLFKELLKQLPEETRVFCIIDGISYYEGPDRRDDVIEAVRGLISIVRKLREPVIKILMSSPASCNYVWELFDQDEILNMSWNCPNRGGLKALDWNTIGNNIKDVLEEPQECEGE